MKCLAPHRPESPANSTTTPRPLSSCRARSTALLALAALYVTAWGLGSRAIAVEPGDWPQWRGPGRDNISLDTGLLKEWPVGGPNRLWLAETVGIGYSSVAVVGDRLYTLGAKDDTEFMFCLDTQTGRTLWSVEIGKMLTNGWGDGPRGTPTVDGKLVYALSGRGNLVCLQTDDGRLVWQTSLPESFGGSIPGWGYTESVLVDGDRVVCTPGGKQGAVLALNKLTGEKLWQSADFTDGAQYASIIRIEHAGQRQYVQLTQQHLVGLSAENGSVQWISDWPGRTAVIPTPIAYQDQVYITSGYGVGCKLVKLTDNTATDVYENKNMKNHHGGVVRLNGYLYGHSDGLGWICQDFATGEVVWRDKSLGKGAVTYADGMLYCLEENSGTVALVEATPEGWQEKGRVEMPQQSQLRSNRGKIWAHPVVAGGRLYVRDQELLYCYDLRQR